MKKIFTKEVISFALVFTLVFKVLNLFPDKKKE